jgi:threonine/homoserine/homoserine lactone efflux protein
MDPLLFLSFLTATLIIVVSPGPSCALASTQAVRHGKHAALLCVAGDALGSMVHIVIAVASLQVLIGLADVLLPYLQIAGGMFILYLAAGSLLPSTSTAAHGQLTPGRSAFLSGFFACVTNPKAIVFFVALFPGFISAEHAILPQTLVYGAIFITLDALSILGYALLASYLVNSAIGPKINIDRLSGFGLLGIGILLIFKGWKALPAN